MNVACGSEKLSNCGTQICIVCHGQQVATPLGAKTKSDLIDYILRKVM